MPPAYLINYFLTQTRCDCKKKKKKKNQILILHPKKHLMKICTFFKFLYIEKVLRSEPKTLNNPEKTKISGLSRVSGAG